VITWTVALLICIALGAAVVHSRSSRIDACRGNDKAHTCVQAEKDEAGMLLMATLGTVVIIMGSGMAYSMTKPKR
jgi:hypothetical protein